MFNFVAGATSVDNVKGGKRGRKETTHGHSWIVDIDLVKLPKIWKNIFDRGRNENFVAADLHRNARNITGLGKKFRR